MESDVANATMLQCLFSILTRDSPALRARCCWNPCYKRMKTMTSRAQQECGAHVPMPSPPTLPPQCTALSAQISATTKRGCRPWAGSPWGPGNWGADFLLPLPPPPNRNGAGPKGDPPPPPPPPPPPACPRTLTAGRHMVNEVPPLAEKGRTLNDEYVGIWDPHGNPAGGPPLPNK